MSGTGRSPGRKGRGRTKDDESATGSTTSARRRRSRSPLRKIGKSSKSILGSLKRSSKPAKKVPDLSLEEEGASPEMAPKAAAPAASSPDDDTVYGVVLDKGTKALPAVPGSPAKKAAEPKAPSSPPSTPTRTPAGPPLQVVLLLMDPKTRRFELLQLEFDSDKAVVADVLSQIALSATEESLRVQKYAGVSDRNGKDMPSKTLLSEFCKANDVILAIPEGMKAQECSKLAKPILNDPKVISMLNPSGGAPLTPVREEKQPAPKSRALPPIAEPAAAKPAAEEKKSGGSFGLIGILVPVIFAAILYRLHEYVTSPLEPGDVLAPGLFRSKCGILSVLPESVTGCKPALLKMGQDGVLSMYHGNNLVWEMTGDVCKEDDEECESGALIREDGKVVIGGSKVTLKGEPSEPLSPWPFTIDPKKGGGFWF